MRDATLSFVSIPFLTADEYVNFLTQKMKTSVVKTSEPICRKKALPNLANEILPVFTLHPHYKSHKGKLSRIRTVEGTLLLKYFWKQLKLARYDPKKKGEFLEATQTGTMLYHDKGITLSQRVSSISNVAALYL